MVWVASQKSKKYGMKLLQDVCGTTSLATPQKAQLRPSTGAQCARCPMARESVFAKVRDGATQLTSGIRTTVHTKTHTPYEPYFPPLISGPPQLPPTVGAPSVQVLPPQLTHPPTALPPAGIFEPNGVAIVVAKPICARTSHPHSVAHDHAWRRPAGCTGAVSTCYGRRSRVA